MIKRTLQIALFISLLPVTLSSFAQIERYVAGTHYTELPNPVNTRDASKVEVLEAFWYGCSHCFRFEPLLTAWEESAPEDVDVVRFPALWNNLMKIHAQVYYAAEALDKLDVLHTPVFNAINLQGNRLQNERQIGSLFAEQDDAGRGVQVLGVIEDQSSLMPRYEPDHPMANADGYVYYPNVNVVEEMADMISASRAFQTNVEMMNTAKQMLQRVLTLGQ